MSTRKTKQEVEAEIEALKALVPVGPFARKTETAISNLIAALKYGVDESSDEWAEMSDEDQMGSLDALARKDGNYNKAPSEGWEGLAEKKARK